MGSLRVKDNSYHLTKHRFKQFPLGIFRGLICLQYILFNLCITKLNNIKITFQDITFAVICILLKERVSPF